MVVRAQTVSRAVGVSVHQVSEHTSESPSMVYTVGDTAPAVTYLHERLADLGYLPVRFVPLSQEEFAYSITPEDPAAGSWEWRFQGTPLSVKQQWQPTTYTQITKGAVMTFQREHHMQVDGFAGPEVFRLLQVATTLGLQSSHPYTHVFVSQSIPQTIQVWQDGKVVFTSQCSTGTIEAPTHPGTHVIYLRNRAQTMEGDAPSGRHYKVENVPFVSFFYKGEAIHGLVREVYGIPQSVGCVELPPVAAKRVWELTDYGSLVTISLLESAPK